MKGSPKTDLAAEDAELDKLLLAIGSMERKLCAARARKRTILHRRSTRMTNALPESKRIKRVWMRRQNDRLKDRAACHFERWSEPQDDLLKHFMETMTCRELAVELGRTMHSIRARIRKCHMGAAK